MTVKLQSLKADLQKEREGEWIDAPDIGQGVAFNVRSTNYPPFVVARDAASMKLARKYGEEPVPPEEDAKINGKLAVEHLLLDWKGFDVEFSEEMAMEVLTDEAYRRMRTSVYMAAMKVGRSEIEFIKDSAKN